MQALLRVRPIFPCRKSGQLPKPVTPALFRQPFHASSPARNVVQDTIHQAYTYASHETFGIINGLHTATGLPWLVTLPLVALLVRCCVGVPIAIGAHIARERSIRAVPILHAWREILQRRTFKQYHQLGPSACHRIFLREFFKKRAEVYRRLRASPWRPLWLQLCQFPAWLLVIDTIRRMCGTHEGLLGLAMKSVKTAVAEEGEASPARQAASLPDMPVAGDDAVPVIQSLATEGGLWFPNLLLPDPMLLLPFMLSASVFANIFVQESRLHATGAERGKWSLRFSRSMKLLALAIGPLTIQLPAAMHVYWLSSSLSGVFQNNILDKYLQSTKPITRRKPKQRFRDGLKTIKPV
jgi:mitochondrial inner membrane protein COX18